MQHLSEEKQLAREKLICKGKREIDLNMIMGPVLNILMRKVIMRD